MSGDEGKVRGELDRYRCRCRCRYRCRYGYGYVDVDTDMNIFSGWALATLLRVCKVVSGTEIAYAATRRGDRQC
eukprot:2187051-Rhodomonas_salina.4